MCFGIDVEGHGDQGPLGESKPSKPRSATRSFKYNKQPGAEEGYRSGPKVYGGCLALGFWRLPRGDSLCWHEAHEADPSSDPGCPHDQKQPCRDENDPDGSGRRRSPAGARRSTVMAAVTQPWREGS